MAANKRNYQQIEADRIEMNRLALAGMPQAEIADRFDVSQPQVAYDLRIVRERWTDATNTDLESARRRELDLLQRVEDEGLEFWQRTGDPRFLAICLKAGEQRAKLLGLNDHPPDFKANADTSERRALLQRIKEAFRQKVRREVLAELRSDRPAGGLATVPGEASSSPAR